MVNNSEEGGDGTRSPLCSPSVPSGHGPDLAEEPPHVEHPDESLQQENQGGDPQPAPSCFAKTSCRGSKEEQKTPRYRHSPYSWVANSGPPRLCPPARKEGLDHQQGQTRNHFQERQGSEMQRPLHGGHTTPPTRVEEDSRRGFEERFGKTNLPPLSTGFGIVQCDPEGRREARAAKHPKGRPPSYGSQWCERGNADEIQWPYSGFYPTQIFELEPDKFGGYKRHARGGQGTYYEFGEATVVPPSWSDLKKYSEVADSFPLHHKEDKFIATVAYNKLLSLPYCEAQKTRLKKALRWTCDPEHYAQFNNVLPPFRRYKTRLLKEDMKILYRSKKLLKIRPRCSVRSFFVVEWGKKRRRPIFWPDLNEAIKKEHLDKSTIPLKREVRRNGTTGNWSLQYDFIGWYDQLPLHQDISKFFAVDSKRCLTTLPMGFRPACEVAQTISESLANYALPEGVSVDIYIDNIRFVGDREQVITAGKQFLERCAIVGAQVDNTNAVPKQEDEFLGERYDYVNKTRCLTDKTLEKLKFVRECLSSQGSFSNRQVAGIFGLLFFSAEVLQKPLCQLFHLMKWYRQKMKEVESQWNAQTCIEGSIRTDISNWINLLLENKAVPLYDARDDTDYEADLTLTVDACETGWGCVATTEHSTQYFGSQWSNGDHENHNLFSSVSSEPLGMWRSVVSTVSTTMKKVIIYTDHLPLVFAMKRGVAKADSYNILMCKLKETYKDVKFEVRFISGEKNVIADFLSRRKDEKAMG